MTVSTSTLGFWRKVSAADLTAFWSRGVKARRACWTRLPELAEDDVGDVERVLGDEVDAHALGADETDDLFDLLQQDLRRVGEQEVGFVEEEDEPRLVLVADLGQPLEELGHQPQQEGRIGPRRSA